jgi:hypothetical protein
MGLRGEHFLQRLLRKRQDGLESAPLMVLIVQ